MTTTTTTTGPRVVDLALGDPGHPAPAAVRVALRRAAERTSFGYAPASGFGALRESLAEKLTRSNRIAARPGEVVVTTGASQGIYATLAALCAPGDRVLVPAPGYPAYRAACRTLGLVVVDYPVGRGQDAAPDWARLEALAGDARVLLWNYPSNPTGTIADPAWYPRLYALLDAHPGLTAVSDEVYEELCFDAPHVSPAAAAGPVADRIVSVFSFSKAYAMTGMRVGYLHARAELAARISRAHWGVGMSTPAVSQLCALAVLHGAGDYPEEHRGVLRAGRDLLAGALSAAGLSVELPSAGCFLWLDVAGSGLDGLSWTRAASEHCRVLVAPGRDFGPDCGDRVRISFAAPTVQLTAAAERFSRWAAAGWPGEGRPGPGAAPSPAPSAAVAVQP
ncbi:pyridoxal phosphate-dependent aminotransferase [Kitasatospora mediocidica]|uniref:pyridoxal phosphate-dependent aminotransferase n=1 Tax=Kitasatospora mediocidica TaxID=58352 RepID=UPI000567DDE5|nr:pyridoxal phosphate-dependent aminotransferase [Kitasatospora mediocidica]